MAETVDIGRERAEAADTQIRRVLHLIDSLTSPTGGWTLTPAGFRELVASRLTIRVAFLAGDRSEHGPLLRVLPNTAAPGQWWGTCPWCARRVLLEQDQLEGRTPVECTCGYHETHDLRAKAEAPSA